MRKIGLTAIGAYVPEEKLLNSDLERMVDTTEEWILTRTGIRERRIAKGMSTSDLTVRAARECLAQKDLQPELLISSTGTAEKRCPYQASIVANKLNLTGLAAFDLNAACSGMVYGMAVAHSMMQTAGYKNAMVTAGEKMSMLTDYTDRASCILFGDGASAVLLSSEEPEHQIITFELGLDATGSDLVVMGGPGKDYYFRQEGKLVFKFAVNKMSELIDLLIARCGINRKDRFHIVPHQANYRIFESVAKNKGLSMEQFVVNIDKYGNTSSNSIGLALKEAWENKRFRKGDLVFLIAFGGGLSWAATAVRW